MARKAEEYALDLLTPDELDLILMVREAERFTEYAWDRYGETWKDHIPTLVNAWEWCSPEVYDQVGPKFLEGAEAPRPVINAFTQWFFGGFRFQQHQVEAHYAPQGDVHIMGGVGSGKCLPAGTLVAMADGTRTPIESVRVGQWVMTLDPATLKMGHARVLSASPQTVKPIVEIVLRNGMRLQCSTDHPLLAPNEEWTPAGSLRPGDRVAVPRRLPTMDAGNLSAGKAVILACLIADGGLTNKVPVFTNTNERLVEDLRAALDSSFGSFSMNLKARDDRAPSYSLVDTTGPRVNRLTDWLRELGLMGKGSYDKFVPDVVFLQSFEWRARFLGYLFACDGSAHMKRSGGQGMIEYYSMSERLVRDVQHLLLTLGIQSKVYSKRVKYNGGRSWTCTINNLEDKVRFAEVVGIPSKEKQLQDVYDWALAAGEGNGCDDILPLGIVRDHIFQRARDVGRPFGARIGSRENRPYANMRPRQNMTRANAIRMSEFLDGDPWLYRLASSDVYWATVVEVNEKPPQMTYDLTVAETHNFVANGIIVHNTTPATISAASRATLNPGYGVLWVAPILPQAKLAYDGVLNWGMNGRWGEVFLKDHRRHPYPFIELRSWDRHDPGSRFECRSLGQDPAELLRGGEFDEAVADEAMRAYSTTWYIALLTGRLRGPKPYMLNAYPELRDEYNDWVEAIEWAEDKAAVESLGVGLNVPSGGAPSHVYTGLFSGGNQPPPPPPSSSGGGDQGGLPPINVTMPFPEEFRPMMDWFQNYMQKGGIEVFQKGQRKALTAHDVARLQSYGPVLQQYEGMRMQVLGGTGPLSSWERGFMKVARDIYGDLTGSMQAKGWPQYAPMLEDVTNYLPMLESDIEEIERREWSTRLPLMGAAHQMGQEVLGLSRQDRLTADDVRKAKENLEALGSDELAEAVRQLPGSMKDAARVLDKMVAEYEQQAEAYRPWARDVVTGRDARKQIAAMESAVDADRMLTSEQRRHAEMYLGLSARGRKPDEAHGPEEMRLRRILDRDEELLFRAGGHRAGRGGEALADFLQEFSIGGAAIRMMVVQRYTTGQVAEWERAAMPYAMAGVQMGLAYGLPYSEAMQGPLGQIMEHEAAMRSYQTGLGVSALEQKAGLLGLLGIEPTFQMGRDIGAIGGPILKGLGAGLGVGIFGTTASAIMGKAGIAGAATIGAIAPWAAVIAGLALGGGALAGQLYSASELEAMQRTEAEMAVGIRQQPGFWQRAGMELRDVWLDAWKNVGVYKGPDIYEQRGQELSAYRGTATFEIDKASVYLENLEGLHLDPAQARELGALLTLGGYSPQQIYGGQAAAAIQQLAPMAQLGQAGAYTSAVERFAGYIGVAPGAGMQSLLTMLPTVAQPAQQAQWMLAGQIVGGVGQQIGLPTETVIAKVQEYAQALAAGVPTWQVQRAVQKEFGVSTLAQVAGYTPGSPMAQMIAGAVTTGSEAQSQAVANIASQFRRYWLYQGMGETEMAQRAAALEEARRGTAVEQPVNPANPFLAALGFPTIPQAPLEVIPGEQPETQAIREAAMAGIGYEAFGYLPGSPQARYMGAIQPKGILESEAWAYVTQFAGPVAQQLGLNQYQASALQRRFYRMQQRGISPAAMNLVAQAMTGQGGIEMALGAPAGFAFDERWARMLEAGTMDPTQYLQLQSLAGLGMGQLGYSMMAGGFGIGAGLAQVMGMFGMAPEPGAQPLILPSGYSLNEQALRGLQWAQLGLNRRQAQLGWEQTQASYEYQMGLGEWGVPGASGWGGGLLGAVQYQKDLIDFTQTLRGVTHELIDLQRTATRHGWEFTERGMEMGFAQQMERLGLSRESQARQQAFQWQQFGFQWQQMQTTQAWAWEDMAWGRTVAAFEYEYAMDELTRNIRLATGREKQGLLRRREHMEEQFAMQESRRGVEEERLAQRQQWEEEAFHRQRSHFQEMAQLEKNNFEMQERHIRERYQLEKEQFEQQKKDQEAIWTKEDERRALQEAWEDRSMQYQLEERQRAVQWQEKVFEFQRQRHEMELEAIGYQEQQQKLQDQIAQAQADYMQMQIRAYSPGGIVWEAFNAFAQWLSGQASEGSTPSSGYQEPGIPGTPTPYDPAPTPTGHSLNGAQINLVLDDGTKFNAHIVATVDKAQTNRAQSGGWGRAWN